MVHALEEGSELRLDFSKLQESAHRRRHPRFHALPERRPRQSSQRQIVDFRKHRRSRSQLPKAQRKGRPTSQYVRQLGTCDQLVRWVKPSACPNVPDTFF